VTINFTYINAGYLTMGYGSLLTFTDMDTDGMYDELTVQRYSTSGKDDTFGNTGIASPYTITLTQWAEKSDNENDAEQPEDTTPDTEQPEYTTTDTGQFEETTTNTDQLEETTTNTGQLEETTTNTGQLENTTTDTEQLSATTTPVAETESTQISAVNTGDSNNPVYVFALIASICAFVLLALIVNKHHS
jgi:hypothetical protein